LVTWVSFKTPQFKWERGDPSELKSTPTATRYFCSKCGTHLAFVVDGAAEIDVTVCSMDDPSEHQPEYHIFNDTRLKWLHLSDGLPAYDDWGP
jgi:hypothetical protein